MFFMAEKGLEIAIQSVFIFFNNKKVQFCLKRSNSAKRMENFTKIVYTAFQWRYYMLEKKVIMLVKIMIEHNLIKEEQKEDYIYALICSIEVSITIGSILLISIFLKNFVPTIGFLIFFFSLRKRTGGYHLNTFSGCYIATLVIYGLVIFVCPFIARYIKVFAGLTTIVSIFTFVLGTVNHPNVHMNRQELEDSKVGARLVLIIEIALIFFMMWINADSIIIAYLLIAILQCTFLLIVAKIKRQEVKINEQNN